MNAWSALESLDPRTLRLLWEQRELEIQALRWAIQNQHEARHCRILQEVAGLPAKRSSRSQDKFLQNQVQKLTFELKAQKEKAQLEKERLEERLQQTGDVLQQLEAELQAFQKSCLLQLARSSWVGRMLRSSTGSVEVVTAETLMDLSDFSEHDQAPTAGEVNEALQGFRLEDVDWNSIAHRYPNLFTNLESNSDQKRCPSPSPKGTCLKIVAVSRHQRFVRILNQSLEETVDLGGFVLQQLVLDFPVCMYRFPPNTLLAPQHHITVWGEGPCSTTWQQPSSLGQEPVHFHSRRGCATLLLNPEGEILSEHQSPRCVTPVSRIFADNTDLSIDCFPLSEARPGADLAEHQPQPRPPRKGRVREAQAGRRRPGPRVGLPRLSTIKLLRQREAPAWPEDAAQTHPELLPAITIPEVGVGLQDCQGRKEHKVRVCRKRVDRGCPMVTLSVQSTAESRFGFRFLSYPPITADTRWPL